MSGKLDQIIKDLLSKIPVIGERFKSDDEEYEEDETQVDIDDEGDEGDEEYDEDEEGSEEDEAAAAKKKKISTIIRAVAIVGIAYLAFDMLMTEEDPNSGTKDSVSKESTKMTPQQKKIAALSAKRKAAKAKFKAKQKAEAEAKLKAAEEAKKQAEAEAKIKAEEKAKRIAAEAEAEAAAAAKQAEVDPATSTQTVTPSPVTSDDARDAAISQVENKIVPTAVAGKKITLVDSDKKNDMVQKALQYVVPPGYETMGRGLVYNCKGKYWACVDRKSYFQCRKNKRWQKQNNKDLECHISQVYATEKDCKTVQVYNINMDIPTDFCKVKK